MLFRLFMTSAMVALLTSAPAQLLAQKVTVLQIGALGADFGLRQISPEDGSLGSMLWLGDLVGRSPRTPKRAVVLSFFAPWCEACVTEMPALQQLQDKLGPKGLQVVGLNVRAKHEQPERALRDSHAVTQQQGVRYPVLFDCYTTRAVSLYVGDSARLPCNVLLDEEGRLVARFQGEEAANLAALETAVLSLLDQAPPAVEPKPAHAVAKKSP